MNTPKLRARSQRHARATKALAEMRAKREAAGLPPVTWREDPMMVIFFPFLIIGIAGGLAYVVATVLPAAASIGVGIAFIVIMGAAGLIMRGVGELRPSAEFKAIGYFLGAGAYVATAVIALMNGVRLFMGS